MVWSEKAGKEASPLVKDYESCGLKGLHPDGVCG